MYQISLDRPIDLFILRTILEIIDHRTRKSRTKSSQHYNLPIAEIKFSPSFFKNKYNFRNLGTKRFKKYLEFLHKEEIVFPTGYYTGGLYPLEDFDYWYDDEGNLNVSGFVNPGKLSKMLKFLKKSEDKYILKSKRISLHIYTGILEIKLKGKKKFHRTLHKTNTNYSLLLKLLNQKYISTYKINQIGGKSAPEQKIKRLRSVLGISKFKDWRGETTMEDFGLEIKYTKGKYLLIEK